MDRGQIMLIGGTEEAAPCLAVLDAWQELCGGSDLLVLATTSRFEREPQIYVDALTEVGATKVRLIYIDKRSDGENESYLTALDQAKGVLIMGGNHLRLTSNLGGTSLATRLRRRNAAGMHVAGTAAGAAYICGQMMTYGQVGPSPRINGVSLTPGLGLLNSLIVEPQLHRQGLGRLLAALAYTPFALGVGLEEGGAVLVAADYELRSVGVTPATLVDTSELEHNSIDEARNEEAICMIGLKLHLLTTGMSYNLKNHQASFRSKASDRLLKNSKNWHA